MHIVQSGCELSDSGTAVPMRSVLENEGEKAFGGVNQ